LVTRPPEPHWVATCPCGWRAESETFAHLLEIGRLHEAVPPPMLEWSGQRHLVTIEVRPRIAPR